MKCAIVASLFFAVCVDARAAAPVKPVSVEEVNAMDLVQIGKLQQAYGTIWLKLIDAQKALTECRPTAKTVVPDK